MKNSYSKYAVLVALLAIAVGCVGNRTTKDPAKLIGRIQTLPENTWQEQAGDRNTTTAE
jgi:hypothetical protein